MVCLRLTTWVLRWDFQINTYFGEDHYFPMEQDGNRRRLFGRRISASHFPRLHQITTSRFCCLEGLLLTFQAHTGSLLGDFTIPDSMAFQPFAKLPHTHLLTSNRNLTSLATLKCLARVLGKFLRSQSVKGLCYCLLRRVEMRKRCQQAGLL